MAEAYDAIVIGAGPNGLVAANHLVDAGWHVLVLEAAAGPGGAVRTAEVTAPGFRNDLFSAFYPLAVGSSVLGDLGLERHGLRWTRASAAVAHPIPDGPAAVLHHRAADTAASLDRFAPGDGDAWLALVDRWRQVRRPLLGAMLSPMPPVRHVAALLARLRRDLLPFARFALLPVRRMADEHFRGAGGGPRARGGDAGGFPPPAHGGPAFAFPLRARAGLRPPLALAIPVAGPPTGYRHCDVHGTTATGGSTSRQAAVSACRRLAWTSASSATCPWRTSACTHCCSPPAQTTPPPCSGAMDAGVPAIPRVSAPSPTAACGALCRPAAIRAIPNDNRSTK